jgi:hypothetical protein
MRNMTSRPSRLAINVSSQAFDDCQEMRKMFKTLRLRPFNPIIRQDRGVLKKVNNALVYFSDNSHKFLSTTQDTAPMKKHRTEAFKRLSAAQNLANDTVDRFAFITEAKRLMEEAPCIDTPQNKFRGKKWEWSRGMTGAIAPDMSKTDGARHYVEGRFVATKWGQPVSARMAIWTCVATKAKSRAAGITSWVGISWKVEKSAEFRFDPNFERTNLKGPGTSAKTNEEGDRDQDLDQDLDDKIIPGSPLYVIGWIVTCDRYHPEARKSEGGKKTKMEKEVPFKAALESETWHGDGFLPDKVAFCVKSEQPVKCTFQVFYVLKKDYAFLAP